MVDSRPFRMALAVTVVTLVIFSISCQKSVMKQKDVSNDDKIFSSLPGASMYDAALLERFAEIRKKRGASYKPRTRHLRSDGSAKYTNRLFLESSPYLLQHAHNPVNWYSWSDDAFEAAKVLKRPLLLSVGYSTCHWCHVMEEESFEDEEIATYMNENYISIKVDREERPDVDGVYMAAVQALTGQGGWPMTVWLAPDRKPFFGGTYFPARDGDRGARNGFLSILKYLKNEYDKNPDKIATLSTEIANAIQTQLGAVSVGELPKEEVLAKAAQFYKSRFDANNGGLVGAPKFPSSLPLRFLLREFHRTGDQALLDMTVLTLNKMAAGGIYDQVGGGFHRYSTDDHWLVPHFEKMLYDNALLAMTYLDAYQVTRNKDYERVAKEILRYVARDMTSPEGAFYSATDADSQDELGKREEGYFFTWKQEELDAVLGEATSRQLQDYFGVTKQGNFEGRNILFIAKPTTDSTKLAQIEEAKELLYEKRNHRLKPHRDEKVLTAWNGLMISAYAQAGRVFANQEYVTRATKAADFILSRLQKNEKLYRSYKDGEARIVAFLDDYAFFIAALLDVYEATSDLKWFQEALRLDAIVATDFEDRENGGFFMTGSGHEKLIAREKPAYDGAEPSGNSIAVLNLLRLGEFTTQDSYRKRAVKAFGAFSQTLTRQPMALSEMLIALNFYQVRPKEIVIVAPKGKRNDVEPFLDVLRTQFVPSHVFSVVEEGPELMAHAKVFPWIQGKIARNGMATAYVCEKGICQFPTTDFKVFAAQVSKR
jgi:uncharacterized protein YyaL (SSP411 family)